METPRLSDDQVKDLKFYGAVQIPELFIEDPEHADLVVAELAKQLLIPGLVLETDCQVTEEEVRDLYSEDDFHIDDGEQGLGAVFSILSSVGPAGERLITAGRSKKIDNDSLRVFAYGHGAVVITQHMFSSLALPPLSLDHDGPTWHMPILIPGARTRTIVDVFSVDSYPLNTYQPSLAPA